MVQDIHENAERKLGIVNKEKSHQLSVISYQYLKQERIHFSSVIAVIEVEIAKVSVLMTNRAEDSISRSISCSSLIP